MPEYLAPGVYVEETSYRSKSIEGVSTSTAGFVGPTRYGPVNGTPELVTSFAEFERIFGGRETLSFEGDPDPLINYLAHGVFAFFDNGGKRVYIARVYNPGANPTAGPAVTEDGFSIGSPNPDLIGNAWATIGAGSDAITLIARYPGSAGNFRVSFRFRVSENVLADAPDPSSPGSTMAVLKGTAPNDVVWVQDAGSPPDPNDDRSATGELYRVERYFDNTLNRTAWRLYPETGPAMELVTAATSMTAIRRVNADVEVLFLDPNGGVIRRDQWENLAFHSDHRQSLGKTFGDSLSTRSQQLTVPFIIHAGSLNGPALARVLIEQLGTNMSMTVRRADNRELQITLQHGSDGQRPHLGAYGGSDVDPTRKTGLKALEDIPDVSIIAAPGHTAFQTDPDRALAIANLLITHCENMRYCIAVLDSIEGQALPEIRAFRAKLDSTRAALYYPFVRILDPETQEEINLPPSAFVAGIYARNDIQIGVHKAPANEVVRGAIDFEFLINKGQQDVLNPENINVLRFFEGRGFRVWGARTASSDPEWKYVNVRRYFLFLERSIDRGTQWVVFENNGDALWANVRRTIEDFLFNEWRSGHLLGTKPEEAYFVRCDRSTMTQNDLDNGRLVCLIGVAPLKPAEFVIFRIGQWTADRKV